MSPNKVVRLPGQISSTDRAVDAYRAKVLRAMPKAEALDESAASLAKMAKISFERAKDRLEKRIAIIAVADEPKKDEPDEGVHLAPKMAVG